MMLTQPSLFDLDDGPPGALVVKRVNQDTIKQPCLEWHYAGRLPGGTVCRFGVWEEGIFQGVLTYGPTASNAAHTMFAISRHEIIELQRIALRAHKVPVTKMISETIHLLKQDHPQLQILVSYADPLAGHKGYVYQAASWTYLGMSNADKLYWINGKPLHSKGVSNKYVTTNLQWIRGNVDSDAYTEPLPPKHKYAFGLNRRMRKLLKGMARPYPKG